MNYFYLVLQGLSSQCFDKHGLERDIFHEVDKLVRLINPCEFHHYAILSDMDFLISNGSKHMDYIS